MGHKLGPEEQQELAALMREYPDWAESHPDIANDVQQPRFHKNRTNKVAENARVMPRRSRTVPMSDYQATFKAHETRPRSTKKPPPTPMERNPAPMMFTTNQRDDFIPKDPRVRPQPIFQKENLERPSGPFNAETSYQKSYVPQEVTVQHTQHPHPNVTDGQIKARANKFPSFNSNTTNKDTYKHWKAKPAMGFTELPTFTGSILYPGLGHHLESTTKTTFKGVQCEPVGLIRQGEGNIQLEGDHDMATTTRSTFKSHDRAAPAEKVHHKPQLRVGKREPFKARTQTQADYADKSGSSPTKAIEPYPETIQLKFNNNTSFTTEQSSKYKGIDVTRNPPPKPIVPVAETHHNGGKFESDTRQRTDYVAHDVREAFVPPVKPIDESLRRGSLPKFHAETSNKHFYKNWDVQPRKRYIDFHEGHKYIAPRDKFDGVSTTRTTFIGEPGKVAPPYLPVDNNAMVLDGKVDFTTIYNQTYAHAPPVMGKLNKEQMKRLLVDLRRRKNQESRFMEHPVMFAQGVGSQ